MKFDRYPRLFAGNFSQTANIDASRLAVSEFCVHLPEAKDATGMGKDISIETEPEERITGNTEWDGLHRPRIYYAVISIFCGIFLSVVDGNICNVALPTIASQLGVSSADSIWVVNAFQLVIMMESPCLPRHLCYAPCRAVFRC